MPDAPKPPTQYAASREWSGSKVDLSRYVHLKKAWSATQAEMRRITDKIAELTLPPEVRTLVVAGSLARMEFTEKSDCDLIVVLTDDALGDD